MQPELIADYECITGEGPMWHEQEQKVYWLDIPRGRLFSYDPATGEHKMVFEERQIGGYTIQDDGSLLLFMDRGTIAILRDGKLEIIVEEIPDEVDTRFNDVFADVSGRVYCGTMSTKERKGRLYRLDPDRKLTVMLEGVGTSNGMGLTPNRKQLYFTDSGTKMIYLFDYDAATGDLTNRLVFVDTSDEEGVPDGMTVDADGNVWSARWDGYRLTQYAPDGTELQRVKFPAKKVSSVIFGGPDYTDMYVTTAGGDDKEENGAGAGALFRINLGIKGVPEFLSKIR